MRKKMDESMKRVNYRIVGFAFCVLGLALAPKPASADTMMIDLQPIEYVLTLTENSSTDLQLTYTNGNFNWQVTFNSADNWTVSADPESNITLNPFTYFFAEEGGTFNKVSHYGENLDMSVLSDFVQVGVYSGISTIIGSDGGTPIRLVFNDLAAASEHGVPDRGSTLALLGLSLAGFIGLRRFRIPRLA